MCTFWSSWNLFYIRFFFDMFNVIQNDFTTRLQENGQLEVVPREARGRVLQDSYAWSVGPKSYSLFNQPIIHKEQQLWKKTLVAKTYRSMYQWFQPLATTIYQTFRQQTLDRTSRRARSSRFKMKHSVQQRMGCSPNCVLMRLNLCLQKRQTKIWTQSLIELWSRSLRNLVSLLLLLFSLAVQTNWLQLQHQRRRQPPVPSLHQHQWMTRPRPSFHQSRPKLGRISWSRFRTGTTDKHELKIIYPKDVGNLGTPHALNSLKPAYFIHCFWDCVEVPKISKNMMSRISLWSFMGQVSQDSQDDLQLTVSSKKDGGGGSAKHAKLMFIFQRMQQNVQK